jgi:hypothetical protein
MHSSQTKGYEAFKDMAEEDDKNRYNKFYGMYVYAETRERANPCYSSPELPTSFKVLQGMGNRLICLDEQGRPSNPPLEFQIQELVYRIRSEIACDSIYTAKGIMRQLLFEKDLEYQRQALKDRLVKNCPEIAAQMGPQ